MDSASGQLCRSSDGCSIKVLNLLLNNTERVCKPIADKLSKIDNQPVESTLHQIRATVGVPEPRSRALGLLYLLIVGVQMMNLALAIFSIPFQTFLHDRLAGSI